MDCYPLFATLLEYPTPALPGQAKDCAECLPAESPEAIELLDRFRSFAETTPLSRLEEIHSSTFDLQPACYPYVGYHLFGESYKRGAFMARLNQEYSLRGFDVGNELPDHVPAILRFLALDGATQFSQTLVDEGLVPALEKMVEVFGEDGGNPYGDVIRALLLVVQSEAWAPSERTDDSVELVAETS